MKEENTFRIITIAIALILLSVCIIAMPTGNSLEPTTPSGDTETPDQPNEPEVRYAEMYLSLQLSITFPQYSTYTCIYVDDVLWRVWPSTTDGNNFNPHNNLSTLGTAEYDLDRETHTVRIVCALVTMYQPATTYTMYDKTFEIDPIPIPEDWVVLEKTVLKVTI